MILISKFQKRKKLKVLEKDLVHLVWVFNNLIKELYPYKKYTIIKNTIKFLFNKSKLLSTTLVRTRKVLSLYEDR